MKLLKHFFYWPLFLTQLICLFLVKAENRSAKLRMCECESMLELLYAVLVT